MRTRSAVWMLLAMLFASAAAVAEEPKPSAKMRKNASIRYSGEPTVPLTADRIERLKLYAKVRAALVGPPYRCVYQTGGVCVIEVQVGLIDDGAGNEYCVAPFPEEVQMGIGDDLEKTIVWRLLRPANAPASSTFTFFDDSKSIHKANGIIVVSDDKKQLKGGRLGDGTTSPPDPTKWLIKHKHQRNSKNTAVYLPLIVRTDDPGAANEKVSVCGTPDPRIAND